MQWFGQKKPQFDFQSTADGQDPRRGAQRQSTDTLSCHLGEVLDISTTGVRVRCGSKPPFAEGAVSTITFNYNGGKLQVSVQERWRKRRGFRGGYEIGMMYVRNSPNVLDAIASLVKFGFLCPDAVAGERPKAQPKGKPKQKLRVSVNLPDYYAVLSIPHDADDEQVHTAYRQLARQYHPDTTKQPGTQERFISICEAYKILSDTEQRKTYDLRRAG
jgi:DnaJ-like protein/PilZ domain-containing protein